ncbi:ABC transporter substrate-binding protein [Arthrobacter mangrovi]|uniref:ABC transporter substrate-binding protein n=1 Tax=Arthrobacter mangrovi TaxID=2966350 RepID=A0ABQ5MRN4_9MICC|nr:ABC transporter substrate-binding protein [Arthrobacter mangrovi]GLB66648.1 hypothetical protein AHIS1636_10870 [Arthrobacter mangrovi]
MPLPVDVGTLLGGRYKVTGQVLASAEQDLVLNGIDQVLNRPVSILVAAPENASQAAMSAREIATGERAGNVQVLDLGITDGYTYLITNQAEAADLLDLVIQQDAPYVEPFFTETLGSEIFGHARTYEPETYEDEDYYDEEEEDEPRTSLRERLNRLELPKLGRGNTDDGGGKPLFGRRPGAGAAAGAGVAGAAAAAASAAGQGRADTGQFDRVETGWQDHAETGRHEPVASSRQTVAPPPPASPPHIPADADAPATAPVGRQTTERPKVSLWQDQEDHAPAAGPALPAARRGGDDHGRAASAFPAGSGGGPTQPDDYDYDYDDDERNRPRTSRLLVGGLLAVLLIVAVVIAVNQLNLFRGGPVAGDTQETNNSAPATEAQGGKETSAPAEEAVEPEIAGLTRLVPDMPALDAENDGRLPQAIDGNPATYWTSFQYQSDDFGRYASNLALVVELKESSSISSIELTQLSGSGGKFSVMLNDTASLEGATPVAQGSFTAQNTTIPVPESDGAAPKAQYVIIDFTQLPRLANPQGGPPFGIRMAEIEIS